MAMQKRISISGKRARLPHAGALISYKAIRACQSVWQLFSCYFGLDTDFDLHAKGSFIFFLAFLYQGPSVPLENNILNIRFDI